MAGKKISLRKGDYTTLQQALPTVQCGLARLTSPLKATIKHYIVDTKTTSNTGAHTPAIATFDGANHGREIALTSGRLDTQYSSAGTGSAGMDAYMVGIGALRIGSHRHMVVIGAHGHTFTVNAAVNTENTVKHIVYNYIVRLA